MERDKQTLVWLRQFAEHKGKSRTFQRCRGAIRLAIEQLSQTSASHRNNVVASSLDWLQRRIPASDNERKYFQRLPATFAMCDGRRVQPQGVFELLGSKALIELLRALVNTDAGMTLCCFELRVRIVGSKWVRLSEKDIDDVMLRQPHIAIEAARCGPAFLGLDEDYFVDLRNLICGLNLIRGMICDNRDEMQRCGLVSLRGRYNTLVREPLCDNTIEIELGPFQPITTAAKTRMATNVATLLGKDSARSPAPEDASEWEKRLAMLALDFFPVVGSKLSAAAVHTLQKCHEGQCDVLASALSAEAARIECAPIVLCKWEAYATLADVMERRPLLANFLHLPNWKHFLAHCIKHRRYAVVRAHYPHAAHIAAWGVTWSSQLAAMLRVSVLQKDESSIKALRQWKSKPCGSATVFELLQFPTLATHARRAIEELPIDAKWSDPRTGQNLLHAACRSGDVSLLASLAKKITFHFRWRDHDGLSPFNAAAKLGTETTLSWLLQQQQAAVYNVAPCWSSGARNSPLQNAMRAGVAPATIAKLAACYSREYLKETRAGLPKNLIKYSEVLRRRCAQPKRKIACAPRAKKRLRLS